MSLVFSAICPHTSLLIPSVAKDNFEKLKNTKNSFEILEKELYISKAQILIIILNNKKNTYFTLNAHNNFDANFKDFGEHELKKEWQGANNFSSLIKEKANTKIKLNINSKLDNNLAIPLLFLTQNLKNIKILPIETANLSKKEFLDFGKELKKIFNKSSKRIAVIATGNMSHSLETKSPAGYTKEGKEYNEKIIELLESHNSIGVANLDNNFIKNSNESNYYSLFLLLGVIQNINYEFKNLSYEAPFGVGYLTGFFDFK